MLDASFLEAEDSDRHVSLAIGSLSVIEGPMPDDDVLMSWLGERVGEVPRFRQVLRTHPLDLEAPEWVDDEHFDISHHVHRAALPHPGDDAALFRLVADVMERRLDRDRPLWETWIIEGLPDGQWATIMKLHHAIADGIATMHMLAGLNDGGEGETYATEIRAAHEQPAPRRFGLPTISPDPRKWMGGAVRTVNGLVEIFGGLLRFNATSLVGPVATMRRYTAVEVSLDDVKKVAHAQDVTLNDVVLAAITDAYRALLLKRGEKPRRNMLRTLVPVSVRANEEVGKVDNRVSMMFPYLPVEKSDPKEQLRAVHERLTRTKSSGQREAGSVFFAASSLVPYPVTAWTLRAMTRLPQRGVVTVATNVPGPRDPIKILGRKVIRMCPILPIALGLRTGIAIVSYADKLVFGITADYDTAPDVDELAHGIEKAVKKLAELS